MIKLSADQAALIDKIIEQNKEIIVTDSRDGHLMRAQHGRSHGCVEASFAVRDDIPQRFQHGIFAAPRSYSAAIRFSNGAQLDDRGDDAHGMAIKLFGVSRPKLLDPYREALFQDTSPDSEQDFVLVDNDLFPFSDFKKYEEVNRLICSGLRASRGFQRRGNLNWRDGFRGGARALGQLLLKKGGREIIEKSAKFASQTMHSPLEAHYWSTQPYRLGDPRLANSLTVRYVARSKQHRQRAIVSQAPDRIRDQLKQDVAKGAAAFEFCVIEPPALNGRSELDGTVRWACDNPEADGASADVNHNTVTHLADITIAQNAAFDPVDGQAFEFSPWRVMPEHEPLGDINLIRLFTYLHMAKQRYPNKV